MATSKRSPLPYRPCAGIVVINRVGLIFAAKRIDNPIDAWQMPQGGIDAGESPRAAALRELLEETGIKASRAELVGETRDWLRYDLPPELLGKIWGGKYRGQRQKWFALKFLGDDDEINIETAHPEFSEWRWMKADEVVEKIVPFKREIYKTVLGEFAPFLK